MVKIVLDLFSGSGSASEPFLDKGYKVYRYDLNPSGADGIFIDLNEGFFLDALIDTWKDKRVKLIWASPPCTDYSTANPRVYREDWIPDTRLWHNTIKIIEAIQPENFVIENVRGAQRTWGPAVQHFGPYYLWGVYPKFSIPNKIKPKMIGKTGNQYSNHKDQREQSAKIPYDIGYYLERAISQQERL